MRLSAAARLVPAQPARPALAANQGPVPRLGLRGHAAADDREDRDSLLRGASSRASRGSRDLAAAPGRRRARRSGRASATTTAPATSSAARGTCRSVTGGASRRPWRPPSPSRVGLYTASAMLSIAYGVALPVVDGNVRRVLSRLFALRGPDWRTDGAFYNLADELLDREAPGDWNQALMELGATVCSAAQARLPRLPAARRSAGPAPWASQERAAGDAARRRAPVDVTVAAALVEQDGRLLLVRRGRRPPAGADVGGAPDLPRVAGPRRPRLASSGNATASSSCRAPLVAAGAPRDHLSGGSASKATGRGCAGPPPRTRTGSAGSRRPRSRDLPVSSHDPQAARGPGRGPAPARP